MKDRYLIGVGDYSYADDSIGLRVLEHIVDNNLDEGFKAVEIGNGGLQLLNYLESCAGRMVLIACVEMARDPGHREVFDLKKVASLDEKGKCFTRASNILETIEMAEKMGMSLPEIRMLAIQPESFEIDTPLTSSLQNRFDEYVQLAIEEVTGAA